MSKGPSYSVVSAVGEPLQSASTDPRTAPPGRAAFHPEHRDDLEAAVVRRFDWAQEAERLLRALDGGTDGIWDWDLRSGRLFVSDSVKALLGYDDKAPPATMAAWRRLIHPHDRVRAITSFKKFVRQKSTRYEAELRLKNSDGQWTWIEFRGGGVWHGGRDLCGLTGTASAIGDRKRAEEERLAALRLADRIGPLLTAAIDVAEDGIALFGTDDRLQFINSEFREAFPPAQGLDAGASYRDMARLFAAAAVADAAADGGWQARLGAYHANPAGHLTFPTTDGRTFRLTEHRASDVGAVVVLRDITTIGEDEARLQARVVELEREKARQADQSAQLAEFARQLSEAKDIADAASRTKSEFLANMSHELRTPLNAIMGFSEVIKNELFGSVGVDQYRQYAVDIYDSGAHLLAIINDILDLSKVEAGKFELNETEIRVSELCRSVIHIIKGRADEAGITLIRSIPDDLPYLVGDPRTIKQMLLNLLSNAIKFTARGGTVDLVTQLEDDGGLRFDVRDTGVGIPRDQFEVVLSPFGQVDTAHARDHQGTGLGLPLVKAFAQMHGGSIEIQSEIDEGTTVTVRFPPERSRG